MRPLPWLLVAGLFVSQICACATGLEESDAWRGPQSDADARSSEVGGGQDGRGQTSEDGLSTVDGRVGDFDGGDSTNVDGTVDVSLDVLLDTGISDSTGNEVDAKSGHEDGAMDGPREADAGDGPRDVSVDDGAGDVAPCTPPVVGGKCDTQPQCGCAPGYGCYVDSVVDGRTACYRAGIMTLGEKCQYIDDCASGLTCIGQSCRAFCEVPSDCSTSGASCMPVTAGLPDGGVANVPGAAVCTDQCRLSLPTGCRAGQTCLSTTGPGDNPGSSLCVYAANATSTTTCAADPDSCASGYVCLTDDVCHKWCRIGHVAEDCGASQTRCVQIRDASGGTGMFVGTQEFGVCE